MTNLTAEDARQLATFLRIFLESRLEIGIFKTLLVTYARDGDAPSDWEQDFEALKQSEMFSSFLKPYEPVLQKLEETAVLIDLKELLSKMPPGTPPN